MPYTFPRQQFNRSNYVSLNEAFHRVGSYSFPDTWTGQEIGARPSVAPEELQNEKEDLRAAAELAQTRANEIRIEYHKETDNNVRLSLLPIMEEATLERDLSRTAFEDCADKFDWHYRDAEAFKRKQTVEAVLHRAIRKKELQTHLGFGTVHGDLVNWANSPKFCVNFSFSFMLAPDNDGSRKRYRAYFDKNAFEEWAEPLTQKLSKYRTISKADDLVAWFKAYRDDLSKTSTRATQAGVLAACKKSFNQAHNLNNLEKQIGAVWLLYAPDDWKKGGAPRT